MSQRTSAGTALLTAALMAGGLLSTGCGRDADDAPVAEMRTETPAQPLATPVSVTGCLRAGEARETFVLTSSRAEDEGRTVTYALTFEPDVEARDLREHVGRQVAIEGVVRAQQAASGYTPSAPAANAPVGTAGEPEVSTSTNLAVRQLEVKELKPLGEACDADDDR